MLKDHLEPPDPMKANGLPDLMQVKFLINYRSIIDRDSDNLRRNFSATFGTFWKIPQLSGKTATCRNFGKILHFGAVFSAIFVNFCLKYMKSAEKPQLSATFWFFLHLGPDFSTIFINFCPKYIKSFCCKYCRRIVKFDYVYYVWRNIYL